MDHNELYTTIVNFLLCELSTNHISTNECKKIYSSVIKGQMDNSLSVIHKIEVILKDCNEYLLQKLWFQIIKTCPCSDIINVFKKEVKCRKFDNLWSQEVFEYRSIEESQIFDVLPTTSSCKLHLIT